MTIGEKIKQARKEKQMTQEQLAEKLIVSRAAIAKWENDNGVPDIENLKKLSQVFGITIDELCDNSVTGDAPKTVTKDEYYTPYIGKKCNVELTDWNDGVFDSYLLNQDEKFLYYITIKKKCKKICMIAKQYIEKIEVCSKKDEPTAEFSEFATINSNYFLDKTVDIYLEDKHFFSGILGGDIEILEVGIQDINENCVKLITGREIETKQITRIETVIN
jgi:transcriptional regulator with XRE-family HTH domain